MRRAPAVFATVGELAIAWLADERQARSRVSHESFVRVHLLPWAAGLPVEAIDAEELEAWHRARALDGYQRATVEKLISCFRSMLKFSSVTIDPARLRMPRRSRISTRRDTALDLRQVARLIRSRVGHLFDRALVAGLILAGPRLNELTAARFRHLDRTTPRLWCWRYAEAWRQKEHEFGPCKDNQEHVVPIHPELQVVLEEVIEVYYGGRPMPDDPVWPFIPTVAGHWLGRHGHQPRQMLSRLTRWNGRTALTHWRAFLKTHGIEPRCAHSARHTFISRLVQAGAPASAIHAITHPGSVPRDLDAGGSAFGRYVSVGWDQRCDAVLSLRLPPVELLDDAQLTLDLEAP